MRGCKLVPREEIEELLQLTYSDNPNVRKKALKRLCPCRLLRTEERVWNRVFEMLNDPSPVVRYQVVHTLADGSPNELETEVVEALEVMWNDEDEKIRKQVRRVLNSYRREGRWNVL